MPTLISSRRLCTVALLSILYGAIWPDLDFAMEPAYGQLEARLIAEGFDSMRIAQCFEDERVRFIPALVELNLVSRELPEIYQNFLAPEQINDGMQFLRKWHTQIEMALHGSRISVESIVAILKIESNLGRQPGKYSIFNALATITLLKDSLQWTIQYDTSGGADLERLQRRAAKRSAWAYGELVHLLNLCERENWDPLEVKGSWAGAFGWPQFLPSSYLRCARDGDGDGHINPYSLQDAVASIAAYLEEAGWRSSANSQRRAIMLYNPSAAYADCVFEYSRQLKQKQSNGSQNSVEDYFNP